MPQEQASIPIPSRIMDLENSHISDSQFNTFGSNVFREFAHKESQNFLTPVESSHVFSKIIQKAQTFEPFDI